MFLQRFTGSLVDACSPCASQVGFLIYFNVERVQEAEWNADLLHYRLPSHVCKQHFNLFLLVLLKQQQQKP